jgi:hypothetical protein
MPRLGNISGGRSHLAGPLKIIIVHEASGTDAFGRRQKRGALSGWGDAASDAQVMQEIQYGPDTGQMTSTHTGFQGFLDAVGSVVTGVKSLIPGSKPPPVVVATAPPTVQQGPRSTLENLRPLEPGALWARQQAALAAQAQATPWGWILAGLAGVGVTVGAVALVLRRK